MTAGAIVGPIPGIISSSFTRLTERDTTKISTFMIFDPWVQ